LKLVGQWKATCRRGDDIVGEVSGFNVITTNGKEMLASALQAGAGASAQHNFRYIAIGSDNTAEAAAQTALLTELARAAGTASYVSGAIYQVTATFASGTGTGTIYEYGLLNSSANGTMLSRDTEGLITKGANDTLTVVCQITLT
jgi:hypothetical protein